MDSKEVNAFAIPGGWIYVNRGLIERAQNMSQLAGVLAPEIGHVTVRHTVQQMQQAQGANTGVALLCTLTKVCESGAGAGGHQCGRERTVREVQPYGRGPSRCGGREDDDQGGHHPEGGAGYVPPLLSERQTNPSVVEGFFATHPLEEDRITTTEAQIATYPANQLRNLTTDTPAFEKFRSRLLALPPSPGTQEAMR